LSQTKPFISYKAFPAEEFICFYCGVAADTIDHIPPKHIANNADAIGVDRDMFFTVPCCKECNSTLGGRPLLRLEDRKDFIYKTYTTKYSKVINIPSFSDVELEEFHGSLLDDLKRTIKLKSVIEYRLLWASTDVPTISPVKPDTTTKSNKYFTRYCDNCGKVYTAKKPHSKYCLDKCRAEAFLNNKNKGLFLAFVKVFRVVGMTTRGMIKLIEEPVDQ